MSQTSIETVSSSCSSKNFVMIGMAQTYSHKGCLITFQQPFPVYLRGKLIQIKMTLYKLMDLDHFTIEKKYQF